MCLLRHTRHICPSQSLTMSSLVFLPLLLTTTMVSTTAAQGGLADCCFKIRDTQIQRDLLKSYYEQKQPACAISAVVFTTVKGKRLCSDPLRLWTQTSMAYLDGKNQHTKPYTTTTTRTISSSTQKHSTHTST